jgi:hypothetical protein
VESLFDETISTRDWDFTDPTPHFLDMMQGETSPDGPMHKVPLAQAPQRFCNCASAPDARPQGRW